jgi:hypothetical protein
MLHIYRTVLQIKMNHTELSPGQASAHLRLVQISSAESENANVSSCARPALMSQMGRCKVFPLRILLVLLPFVASCDAYNQLFGNAQCDTLAITGIPSLVHVGDTTHLRVYLRDKHNRSVQCVGGSIANWSSSDTTVLESTRSPGQFVARKPGKATVTAHNGEMSAQVRIAIATP